MLKRIVEAIKYRYNRQFRSDRHTFVSAIDLMQPINGEITAAQMTVITRLLDVELVRQGKPSYWDVRIAKFRQFFSEEECSAFHRQTECLVRSMDTYGWDYHLSSVMVNREPLFAYNGTHRLGYMLQKNPFQMIPLWLDYNGWNWSQEEGVKYFRNKGLTVEELQVIKRRYDQLLSEFKYDYMLLILKTDYKENEDFLKKKIMALGTISSITGCEVSRTASPSWFSKRDRQFFKTLGHKHIIIIRFHTLKKDLCFKKGEFRSVVIEHFVESLGIKKYTYTPTITKSIEMDIWLKENCKEI